MSILLAYLRSVRNRTNGYGSERQKFSHIFNGTVVTNWVCATVYIADRRVLRPLLLRGICLLYVLRILPPSYGTFEPCIPVPVILSLRSSAVPVPLFHAFHWSSYACPLLFPIGPLGCDTRHKLLYRQGNILGVEVS